MSTTSLFTNLATIIKPTSHPSLVYHVRRTSLGVKSRGDHTHQVATLTKHMYIPLSYIKLYLIVIISTQLNVKS